uniref:Pseudouridine synthase RsuA/RluA-like domain-containing protein n=1 Tax=Pyrodinium bahamense TaxID=73915 RepID=A0A7S0FEA3_9DINO
MRSAGVRPKAEADGHSHAGIDKDFAAPGGRLQNRLLICEPRKEPHAAVDQNGIVVVYKPAFWTVTTPGNGKEEATIPMKAPRIQRWLINNLGEQYPFLRENPRAGLVHRLDVQTSGPILVATNADTMQEMRCNLRQKMWYKEYVALMHGAVPPKRASGVLNYKLFTQRDRGYGWFTEVNDAKGEDAQTRYEALEAYRCRTLEKGSTQRYTLMRVQLITGRTHQIRVHLAEFARELGLQVRGIVGDYKYLPGEQVKADRRLCQRVFLHAQKLHFPPPANRGPPFRVTCPLPVELRKALAKLEKDERTTAQFKENVKKEPALPVDYDSGGAAAGGTLTSPAMPGPTTKSRCRADGKAVVVAAGTAKARRKCMRKVGNKE